MTCFNERNSATHQSTLQQQPSNATIGRVHLFNVDTLCYFLTVLGKFHVLLLMCQ